MMIVMMSMVGDSEIVIMVPDSLFCPVSSADSCPWSSTCTHRPLQQQRRGGGGGSSEDIGSV